MGEVEVLPGYFARTDSSGFVWRCHGADWARCAGGRPGTCAQLRLNTSITCEECEPYTRMTNDGPCKAQCVVLLFRLPESVLDMFSCNFSEMSCGDGGREKQWIGSGSGRVLAPGCRVHMQES